jgi:amino acid adenylation domain-containing protein
MGLLQEGVTEFNVPLRFLLIGPLNVGLLERTLNTVIERQEALRTHFVEQEGELLQIVSPALKLSLEVEDIGHWPVERKDAQAAMLCHTQTGQAFRLDTGPLIRAALVRLGPSSHWLHITVHQAIFDGGSATVLMEEIAAIYQAFFEGSCCPLEALPLQFGDCSAWQNQFLKSPEMRRQLAWWKQRLQGMSELDLPTEFSRPADKSWKCDSASVLLPRALTDRLDAIAAKNGATPAQLHFAAYNILLHRYTGSTDIAIGTTVDGRTPQMLSALIGMFTQSLILRNDLSGNPSFELLLAQVRDTSREAMDNQHLPFEYLVRELQPERDTSRNPLFQVHFSQEKGLANVFFGGVSLTPMPSRSPGTLFDLHLRMTELEDGWRAVFEYSVDLFSGGFAERLIGHFRRLLEDIAQQPSKPIGELEMLTAAEQSRLFGEWKGVATAYPREATIGGLFQETVHRFPQRVALRSGGVSLTYVQLHAEASQLALQLIEAGVVPGDLIAISSRPSPEMIVGFLAILLAGGGCVPIDPAYPKDRFALLLEDCGTSIGLTTAGCEGAFPPEWKGAVIPIRATDQASVPATLPLVPLTAEHPAHLLFTSGSTGRPKGVLLPHRGVVRLVRDQNFMPITPNDVFLQAAPATFDASLLEIWGPLLNGGCLVLMPNGSGILEIATAVAEQGVTTLWLTSGLFQVMMSERPASLKGLRCLLSGGDVLSPLHVRRALECLPGTQLINGYGPTENTTFTTCHTITPADLERPSIPIGRPIANTTIFLLDAMLRPVPVGIPGELFAGGDGLAIGYQGAAALTAEKFITHPVFGRLYRTGDRCRRTSDGTLEFLGRSDHQVKVRGFRIELGEIESLLASHPDVAQAKVSVRGECAESKRILAWVIPKALGQVQEAELAQFLAVRLPTYMRPEAISIVESFPLNANGKVQVSALPDPAGSRMDGAALPAAPPVGETEEQLAAIWSELLGIPAIGRDDDFFALGGHSLMAFRMFSRISHAFDKSLPLATLLQQPTIRLLASALLSSVAVNDAEVPPLPGKGNVVNIARGGDDTPLFCIHGGDGGVLFYRNLAALMPPEIPLHAIESLELGSSGPVVHSSIEETAAGYIRSLQVVQPCGPYRLAGYSFGGVVAHEMALQLTRDGHEVEFVGLFDTHNPAAPVRYYSMRERLRVFWSQNAAVPVWRRLWLVQARLREGIETHHRAKAELRAAQGIGPAESYSDLRRVQVRQHNWRAMQAYRPQPYQGRITLFKAAAVSDKLERPADYGWAGLAGGGLDVVLIAGEHLTLFASENIESLARALTDSLRQPDGVDLPPTAVPV